MNTAAISENSAHQGSELPTQVLRPLRVGFASVLLFVLIFAGWAALAPLATSIHATGHLNAPQPKFDIQHPFCGDIKAVLVKEHQSVEAGQILVQMDVSNEIAQRAQLQKSLQLLLDQRDALAWSLNSQAGELVAPARPDATMQTPNHRPEASLASDQLLPPAQATEQTSSNTSQSGRRIRNMVEALHVRRDATTQTAEAMRNRAAGLENSLLARTQQRASMQARFDRYSILVQTGALRASDNDTLLEAMLDLDASMRAERAEVNALHVQTAQVALQVKAEELELRQKLLDRQGQVAEAIPRIRMQILRTDAQVRSAELRAPTDGTITRLHYDTDQMFVPRGETVLTLTRPTQSHRVSFVVPTHAIDQTRIGMQGHLTVSSLPQRNHPKVRVQILSLSPEARRNNDGVVLGYDGVATINAADMKELRAQMGEGLTLSIDMPVSLVFAGRETTFSDYLIGPFLDFLANALQD
ncbi:MAG: HlyD family efflux transporter periplasmic adaptor subunit [Shimia sp.]|uniref:HlyD family efflux transporter periplasmic adaptor subunit n=1 Tax=Shimia sp. TaxID=1954381 RepID=UPI004059616B